jgi:hypothetical protein
MMLAQSSVATSFVSFLAACTMGVTTDDVDLMMLMTKMVDVVEHPSTLFATVAAVCDSLDVPADATEEVRYWNLNTRVDRRAQSLCSNLVAVESSKLWICAR